MKLWKQPIAQLWLRTVLNHLHKTEYWSNEEVKTFHFVNDNPIVCGAGRKISLSKRYIFLLLKAIKLIILESDFWSDRRRKTQISFVGFSCSPHDALDIFECLSNWIVLSSYATQTMLDEIVAHEMLPLHANVINFSSNKHYETDATLFNYTNASQVPIVAPLSQLRSCAQSKKKQQYSILYHIARYVNQTTFSNAK